MNEVFSKDLGIVTAYGYALSKGYTGTEEQFATLMANYATIGQQAVDAALAAEGYAVGTHNGTPVPSTDPAYHNNAKYFAELIAPIAPALDYALAAFPTETLTNQPVASFIDGADSIPVKDLVIDITPVQSGSGDPAPDNVRPISGWTGANIEQMGKNLIIRRMENRAINSGGKVAVSDSYDLLIAPCKAGVSYTISNNEVGVVYAEFATLPSVGDMAPNGRVVDSGKSFSASMNGYVAFRTSHGYATPQIEVGTVATSYVVPLTPTIYSVSWNTEAGTVYGGTLDVTTGVLTVTHASIASYNGESINEPWISSMDVYSAGATPTTGAQVVYPLSTPQTYQLTPSEIKTLLGANNIWADTGNVNSLTYRADSTLYINEKVAALTALISES